MIKNIQGFGFKYAFFRSKLNLLSFLTKREKHMHNKGG